MKARKSLFVTYKRISTQRGLVLGALICAGFVFAALFTPRIAPLEPIIAAGNQMLPGMRIVGPFSERLPLPPRAEALLGSYPHNYGQVDIGFSILWGARGAIFFGLTVVLGAALLGILIGAISGYSNGWVSWLLMRITDGFLTFPLIAAILLSIQLKNLIIFQTSNGIPSLAPPLPPLAASLFSLQFVMILFLWMPYARLMNAMVLQIKSNEFVEAARAMGASHIRILFRHLIPNCLAPLIVYASRDISAIVLLQAALSFVRIPANSVWGDMLAVTRDWVIGYHGNPFTYWWVYIPVSLTIILFGVGWNMFGDGLNHLLNPRRQRI